MAYRIEIDYERPLEEGIKLGQFTAANLGLTDEHYPPIKSGSATIEMDVLRPGTATLLEEALKAITASHRRPAEIRELVALATATSLGNGVILSLASKRFYPYGYWLCPSLQIAGMDRRLWVQRMDVVFRAHCAFATVSLETS